MREASYKFIDTREVPDRVVLLRQERIRRMSEHETVDAGKKWIPERFTIAYYLPSYRRLSLARRTELNQLYALKFCESTLFLESWIELCLLQNRDRGLMHPEDVVRFVLEEREHTSWFIRLLSKSRPDKYGERGGTWLLPRFLSHIARPVGRIGFLDIFWLFLGLYFEERFLTLNRMIQENIEIDEYHRSVHSAHVVDESAHVRDDTLALRVALARSSGFKKWVNARLIRLALAVVFENVRFGAKLWAEIKDATPEERRILRSMRDELALFIRTPEYRELVLSKRWNPITYDMVRSEPSLRLLLLPSRAQDLRSTGRGSK